MAIEPATWTGADGVVYQTEVVSNHFEEHFPWHYTEYGTLCACGAAMDRDENCPRDFAAGIVVADAT